MKNLVLALALAPTLSIAQPSAAAPGPRVSTAWLQQHLDDPQVHVIFIGDRGLYDRAHIPGARLLDHMETLADGHRLLPPEQLAKVLVRAGAADGSREVLYGDSPMATGWLYMAITSVGHAGDVSMLDGGIELWRAEHRPVELKAPPAGHEQLTVHPAPDFAVDAAWVRSHLDSTEVRVLDVRTTDEWKAGHLPGATLILWQDLFADRHALKFKSPDERRALFAQAGVKPGQQIVTYCAVGMRASLMYWAALSVGLPARVYVGSYSDWKSNSANPIVR